MQLVRSDGTSTDERLEGVWPENEDWIILDNSYLPE